MKNSDAAELFKRIKGSKNYKPNDWEEKFLESVSILVEDGNVLTHKQGRALETIYKKAYGGGDYVKKEYI